MILRLISDDHYLQQRFIPVYRPDGKGAGTAHDGKI